MYPVYCAFESRFAASKLMTACYAKKQPCAIPGNTYFDYRFLGICEDETIDDNAAAAKNALGYPELNRTATTEKYHDDPR